MSEGRKTKEFRYITLLKTCSLIFVVVDHCMLFYADNPFFSMRADNPSEVVKAICDFLDVVVIAGFVLASGFLSASGRPKSIPGRIGERAKRLLIPYYLYGCLWLVPLYTIFDFTTFGRESGMGLVDGYIQMAVGVFADHLWFLWMLFWISLFWILCQGLLKKERLIMGLIVGTAMALADQYLLAGIPYFKINQIAPYILCFFSGVVLFCYREELEAMNILTAAGITVILFMAVTAYCLLHPSAFVWLWIIKIIGALMCFFLFMVISKLRLFVKGGENPVWKFIERNSMDIYLFNMPFPYLFFRMIYPYVGDNAALCIVVNMILSFASIFAIVAVKEKLGRMVHDR